MKGDDKGAINIYTYICILIDTHTHTETSALTTTVPKEYGTLLKTNFENYKQSKEDENSKSVFKILSYGLI